MNYYYYYRFHSRKLIECKNIEKHRVTFIYFLISNYAFKFYKTFSITLLFSMHILVKIY